MTTKEKVLHYLEQFQARVVSGQEIADQLRLSRNSVWKAVKALQADGVAITALANKGYQLDAVPDSLAKNRILPLLDEKPDYIAVHSSLDSTNNAAKTLVAEQAVAKGVILSEEQTKGRGRLGRQFYSPEKTGLYMSLIYKNDLQVDAASLTTAAAVAVCKAIETLTGKQPGIKWVNDIFLERKKICGILTEGIISMETGTIDTIIVGIGLNVRQPERVPEEIKSVLGALFTETTPPITRNQLAGEIINQMGNLYKNLKENAHLEEYRKRCFILGENISFEDRESGEVREGTAHSIDEEGSLVVQLTNGRQQTLRYGEISINIKEMRTTV